MKVIEEQGLAMPTPSRKNDGAYLIFLSSCIVLLLSITLILRPSHSAAKDFRVVYFPAKAMLDGLDPYNPDHVLRAVHLAGEDASVDESVERQIQVRYVYPPTAFAVTVPFALLPWRIASILWMVASTFGLILSAFMAWDLSRGYAPTASAILIAYLLANSEVVVVLSNPSALAISLAVIGTWCVLKNRSSRLGIVLFALSICLKPQDSALVWCFLFASSESRRRSLHIAILSVALSVPMLLWTWHASPHWPVQIHANYASLLRPGGPADPGPLNPDSELVNFQVVFSRIKDAPAFYNLMSYLSGGILLLAWALFALRFGRKPETSWLSLAAVVPLSLLPVYHHFYDTKLLLLCIPGFAQLWSARQPKRWFALVLTLGALIVTGDLSHTILNRNHLGGLASSYFPAFPVLIAPVVLCLLGLLYLWAFRQAGRQKLTPESRLLRQ